jgi:uncharacterized membrane protein YdjX (TVP38/TMEM64 family)
MRRPSASLWRVIAISAAVVGAALAWRWLPLSAWLDRFQAWIAGLGPLGALLYGLVYVAAVLLFVPGILLTLGAGFLFGFLPGTVLVSAASTTAAALAFLIARYLARPRVEKIARHNPRFAAIDRAIGESGWKIVALLRLSPLVPFSLSNYLYGLTAVRFLPYVATSLAAMLPATFLYVSLGAAGKTLRHPRHRTAGEWALLAIGLAATIAVTVLLTRLARKELRKMPTQKEAL